MAEFITLISVWINTFIHKYIKNAIHTYSDSNTTMHAFDF